ncbi:biotin transporter BioY [Gloeocapsopsis dulcis]|uniref:biotin transporter BioY n=1 Tax=Gloeocapsopsis dulcis TaxID=2859516 RepID=UPI0012DA8500|nr:biotin transporter BioY [Gloeocapsopsis dulcis]WNN87411.1 biotin transporter BioY [Gloeocapsopsis dulcis]
MHVKKIAAVPHRILWSLVGLLLTIGGTFIEAHFASAPWSWNQYGVQTTSLGVTYQIGAVLLVGCLGGKTAGALSQIAYVVLGLTWLPVFYQGGGMSYLSQPYFGYLLGFILGAWVCGFLAFQSSTKLESLAFSCLCGLLTIHLSGLVYLLLNYVVGSRLIQTTLLEAVLSYSVYPLPGHLVIACTVAVLSYCLRYVMLY